MHPLLQSACRVVGFGSEIIGYGPSRKLHPP